MKTLNSRLATCNSQLKKGVTLLEMVVVIGIIMILVALGTVEWSSMDDKAVRNGSLVSAKAIGDALRMYQVDKGNQGYTCTIDKLAPYVNLTSVKSSFTSVAVESDDCTFASFAYLRITGTVKGIQPGYIVNYYVEPVKDPECSSNGATPYPCKNKY